MDCEKCRGKALHIAAVAQVVGSVSIEGKDKDEVVVVGDEVDSVCLAKTPRKKSRHAKIVSVQEVRAGAKTVSLLSSGFLEFLPLIVEVSEVAPASPANVSTVQARRVGCRNFSCYCGLAW
ncbi:Heavy metal transport/detoxification protein [Quillaja saponaria]|uniref:Heavy metal transport/detoxification protein n=1 Tax=Quillaja saponaria TaxID=32244 RepID=A0AAD7LSG8_QUISA|nr:Heavy metal transport/detoxification protein [Quillaja saponaria]